MGKHTLFCVFGAYEQDYTYVHIDGLCDYAFIPFYVSSKATFVDDSEPAIQNLLGKAARANITSFGIHVTVRQVHEATGFAKRHLASAGGQSTLRNYWTTKKIFHYGVLNLEVKPWDAETIANRVKQTFDFLKEIRAQQEMLKTAHPGPPSPPRGFIVLGIRLWPANMTPLLAEIDKEFKSFIVDGLIPLTHINEDEFIAGYKECWITGGAPYQLAPNSNNTNVLGMVKTMEAIDKFTQWRGSPSLAVSVSMCTRVYKAQATKAMDAPCVAGKFGVNTTHLYCNSLNPYENPTVDATQNVVVGTSKNIRATDLLSTFESRITINSKLCDINKMFGHLDIGLAVFDLECEDWIRKCPAPTAGLYATYRFRNVSQQTRVLAMSGVANACP
ncbi:hypothetical protein HPB50_006264 [Hyalomma asiaticum]|uniref:Uncharacterized protein n=1 Tax=Hyalomma asiaticum TaxID=266040 RepID=A0ACB7SC72_HYAAI|nr:hypothetical protein HPB50_006264 [Hyalomma asiaticum]